MTLHRREDLMSLSLGHRAIFNAFGHRHTPIQAVTVATPSRKDAAAPSPEATGELKCSPWEGLYLDQARPATEAHEAASRRELDSFLAGLMYGE